MSRAWSLFAKWSGTLPIALCRSNFVAVDLWRYKVQYHSGLLQNSYSPTYRQEHVVYSLEVLLVISLVTFLFGLGLGALLSRLWFPAVQQRTLEERLHSSRQEFENYQHEVAKHFVETSSRIGDLTQSYKALHEHLARGAANLASPDISQTLLEAASHSEPKTFIYDEKFIEQPKDWAPKAPGQKGTLREDYGLHDLEPNDRLDSAPSLQSPR